MIYFQIFTTFRYKSLKNSDLFAIIDIIICFLPPHTRVRLSFYQVLNTLNNILHILVFHIRTGGQTHSYLE